MNSCGAILENVVQLFVQGDEFSPRLTMITFDTDIHWELSYGIQDFINYATWFALGCCPVSLPTFNRKHVVFMGVGEIINWIYNIINNSIYSI